MSSSTLGPVDFSNCDDSSSDLNLLACGLSFDNWSSTSTTLSLVWNSCEVCDTWSKSLDLLALSSLSSNTSAVQSSTTSLAILSWLSFSTSEVKSASKYWEELCRRLRSAINYNNLTDSFYNKYSAKSLWNISTNSINWQQPILISIPVCGYAQAASCINVLTFCIAETL